MNKDKQEDKVKKIKSLDVREAMKILDSALMRKRIEIPQFEMDEEEDLEINMFNEVMFTATRARKVLRKKRVWLFMAGGFIFTKYLRTTLKEDYKECLKACNYLIKNKKKVKQFISIADLGILDSKGNWKNPHYSSGDNVSCRMRPDGRIEKRVSNCWEEPKYRLAGRSDFFRVTVSKTAAEKWEQRQRAGSDPQRDEKFLQKAPEAIEKIRREMSDSTEPFKGESAFRVSFMARVNNLMWKEMQMKSWSLGSEANTEWIHLINPVMYKAWKKRVECTENSKNSSTPKGEDSQS